MGLCYVASEKTDLIVERLRSSDVSRFFYHGTGKSLISMVAAGALFSQSHLMKDSFHKLHMFDTYHTQIINNDIFEIIFIEDCCSSLRSIILHRIKYPTLHNQHEFSQMRQTCLGMLSLGQLPWNWSNYFPDS